MQAYQRGTVLWRSQRIEVSLQKLLSDVKAAESNQRDYLLTGTPEFRTWFIEASNGAESEINLITELTTRNDQRSDKLLKVRPLVEEFLASLTAGLDANGGASTNRSAFELGIEIRREPIEKIQFLVNQMFNDEEDLVHQQADAVDASMRRVWWGLGIAYFINVLIVVSLYRSVKRYSLQSAEGEGRLSKLNSELEDRIKQRTAMLSEREELLEMFVRYVPAAVVMLDRDLRILQVSDRYCAEFGVARDRMTGRRPNEAFSDFPDRWIALLQRCVAGESLSAEADPWDHNGETLWSRWEIRPWGSKDGLPEGVLVFTENITARKRTEEALRASEELLQIFVRSVPAAVIMFDQNLRILKVSNRYCEVFDVHRELLEGRTPNGVFPDFPERWIEILHRGLRGEHLSAEEDRWDRDGHTHWQRWESVPWGRRDGKPEGVLVFIEDITARKQFEEAQRAREEQLNTFVQHMPAAVAMLNRDLRFLEVSDQWCMDYGLDRNRFRDQTPDEAFPAFPDRWLGNLKRALAGETVRVDEDHWEYKGKTMWLRAEIRPWGSKDGLPEGVLVHTDNITARKEMEEAIRHGAETLRTFVRYVPVAVAMLDREMRYLKVSDRWCQDNGVSREQLTGNCHYDVVRDLPERWKEMHRRCLQGETLYSDQDRWDHNGKVQWLRWEIRPWGMKDGLPEGIILFAEDISARKQIEDALRESEALLRAFVRHVPVAVAMVDRDMRYLQVSDHWCLENGVARKQIIGRCHYDVIPWLPERWRQTHRRSLQGETLSADEDFYERDGELRWLRWETRPWGSKYGLPEGIIIFSEDITARKEIEQALRESEATNRTLLDTASQAILVVDGDGCIVLANKMVGQIFGYQPNELVGLRHDIFVPQRFREEQKLLTEKFVSHPEAVTGRERVGLRKDGTEFPIELNVSSLHTKRGLLVVVFISDITERKRIEAQLRENEERLRALAGSLLSAQEKERSSLARELHDGVTQELAFLSIELGRLVSELPPSMAHIRTQLQSLQKQALRDSSEVRRISHGLHSSAISDFGLSVALEEFCEEFEKARGVKVSFEGLQDDADLNHEESSCLYRIAQESMRNAADHGRASQVRITLKIMGEQLQMRVQDNGIGFDLNQSKDDRGLGIISMKERVRLVNGTLQLSSKPGHGTTVIASIPLVENHR
jgi:PAS domain S-box-containing protein